MAFRRPSRDAAPPATPIPGWLAPALIAAAALLAYSGSLQGPFVFDDLPSIANNPTLRHFSSALSPPGGGLTVSGRPLLNLSFAVNRAISGEQVWSYHAMNLLVHILAALALLGVLRRTSPRSEEFALAVALLWAVHPLQTESVTYLVQRAESLMGLFYLLTLYCFIRGAEDQDGETATPASSRWLALSWLTCILGMGTKEVMVTAPVLVLLYDRSFVSGSFAGAWRVRRRYYACLAGTWLPLACLVAGTSGRGGTAGFAVGVPWWEYGLTQFRAIAHYLRLSVWPVTLIFDYGPIVGGRPIEVAADAAMVACLAVVSTVLCLRRRPSGFLGLACLLILMPSSSVVPVPTETIAEHRMYLSLAAVLAAIVGGASALAGKWRPALGLTSRNGALIGLAGWLGIAVVLGIGTARRNELYRSGRALWSDTVRKFPANARGHNNLGIVLAGDGDLAGAEAQFRAALALFPDFVTAHVNLGTALLRLDRIDEARGEFAEALRLDSSSSAGHFDLGSALEREGRIQAAAAEYREALRLSPDYGEAWYNLGNLLVRSGQLADAGNAYASSVLLRPDFADGHVNFGNVLTQLDRKSEAIREFQAALRLQPDAADVHVRLGELLAATGRWDEARAQYQAALRLEPGDRDARAGLERVEMSSAARAGP